jgi:CRISPR-associated endonuclease/helicase Cas3
VRGNYDHDLRESYTDPKLNDSKTHRRILHEAELELITSQQDRGGIEAWVSENLEIIVQFFKQHPESKGLLIVNSVFAAKKVVRILRSLPEFKLSVGENTGLTSLNVRRESENAQLIVATSTVDVGVDFAINFLIYESLDAGTFIQRLGRLGRHDGFSTYKAIALVPDWVREKFSKTYSDGVTIDRESFFKTVREDIYKKPQEFEGYLNRWGTALSSLRYIRLNKQKQQYQTLLENYTDKVKMLIGETPNWSKLRHLDEHKIIINDLESFRGSGQLDIWVYDPDTQAVTSMSLIRLLAGTDFMLISEDQARTFSDRLNHPFYKNKLGLYACINDYLQAYEKVELVFTSYLDELYLNIAQERKGFRLNSHHTSIQQINDRLEYLPLTTCVADPSQFDLAALRRFYRLPALFELHLAQDRSGAVYPVAFGLDALLLDSLIFWKKPNGAIIH